MPRPLRLEFPNAWYHVMNRGAGRKNIYKSAKHRQIFLDLLEDASQLFGIEIHAYCLMGNHYHLLIKTPRGNLSRAMRHINGIYTQRFNRLERSDGSLFRGRYKAIIVDKDAYLLQVSRYIHLNPINAKMTTISKNYNWSSYQYYLRKSGKPGWLYMNEILSMVSQNEGSRLSAYKQFVSRGNDIEITNFYAKPSTPVILGASQFKTRLLKKLDHTSVKASLPDYRRTMSLPTINKVSKICADYFKVKASELYQGCRGKKNDIRKIAIYGCRMWCAERISTIASLFCCASHTIVSNTVREMNQRMRKEERLSQVIGEIKKLCQIST